MVVNELPLINQITRQFRISKHGYPSSRYTVNDFVHMHVITGMTSCTRKNGVLNRACAEAFTSVYECSAMHSNKRADCIKKDVPSNRLNSVLFSASFT